MGLSDRETAAFEQYFYHITAARGSGEHALRHILGPFAWAREALEEDLKDIKVTATKGVLINQNVVPVQSRCLGEHALPQPGALRLGRPRRRTSGISRCAAAAAGPLPCMESVELFETLSVAAACWGDEEPWRRASRTLTCPPLHPTCCLHAACTSCLWA